MPELFSMASYEKIHQYGQSGNQIFIEIINLHLHKVQIIKII